MIDLIDALAQHGRGLAALALVALCAVTWAALDLAARLDAADDADRQSGGGP